MGHPSDGSAVQDDDLRMLLLPSLISGARSMEQVSAFTPQLNYLSESELEKNEKDNIKALEKERKRVEKRQAEIVKLQVCVNAKERDAHFNSGCIGSDGGGSGFGFTCSS